MNHILAKISRVPRLLKLISNESLYEEIIFDDNQYINYIDNPSYLLEENEWFRISEFTQQDFCLDFLNQEFHSAEYQTMERNQFNKIKYVVSYQNGNFYFQKITPSQFIRKKIMSFNEHANIIENENYLTILEIPDAVYFSQQNTLIFKRLSSISSIFRGIDELFREATDEEVSEFLQLDIVQCNEEFTVSANSRKRITRALEILDSFNDEQKIQLIEYIREYPETTLEFSEESQSFIVPDDNQLKNLLNGIEQKFYTAPIGRERRLANSVRLL